MTGTVGFIDLLRGFNGLHILLAVAPIFAAGCCLDWKSRHKK
jgi:hypothetical protein